MNLKEVYDQHFFFSLAKSLAKFCAHFDEKEFLELIYEGNWEKRELKDRMRHICYVLNKIFTKNHQKNSHSGGNYQSDIEILKKVASDVIITSKYPALSLIIFANYVEIFGLDNLEISMEALEFFTPIGSAEFAVRPFYVKYPQQTLQYFLKWSKSENYHVRRLASEGARPRLPWGIALQTLKKDPTPIIPILENLKDDETEYVRKSVANNLNDICKDNPKIALILGEKWLKNPAKNSQKLVKHGLRTLLKSSNSEALKLFDYVNVKNPVELFDLQNFTINIGENLGFNFKLRLENEAKLRIEYAIYFLRKDQKFSKKVFQITEKNFEKGEFFFQKKHSFRPITTRKYNVGTHKISLIINGDVVHSKDFLLLAV